MLVPNALDPVAAGGSCRCRRRRRPRRTPRQSRRSAGRRRRQSAKQRDRSAAEAAARAQAIGDAEDPGQENARACARKSARSGARVTRASRRCESGAGGAWSPITTKPLRRGRGKPSALRAAPAAAQLKRAAAARAARPPHARKSSRAARRRSARGSICMASPRRRRMPRLRDFLRTAQAGHGLRARHHRQGQIGAGGDGRGGRAQAPGAALAHAAGIPPLV